MYTLCIQMMIHTCTCMVEYLTFGEPMYHSTNKTFCGVCLLNIKIIFVVTFFKWFSPKKIYLKISL